MSNTETIIPITIDTNKGQNFHNYFFKVFITFILNHFGLIYYKLNSKPILSIYGIKIPRISHVIKRYMRK